ncbi:LysM peptidoglycan-binding domain-containing protein [bacterium]|nr:LysM peptidoglycan-binding domain-containing protein [bacterium]
MSVRLTTFALLSGASMLSAATDSERLDRLESEVAQLGALLKKMTGEERAQPTISRSRPRTTSDRTHRIRSGDSYWSIARRYKTTVSALQEANPGVDPRRLSIGKTISIPGRQTFHQTASASGTYRVKNGDILGRISEAHGIRLHQLLSANPGLEPRRLKIGTILKIPGAAPIAKIQEEPQRPIPEKLPPRETPTDQPAERSNPYLSDIVDTTQPEVRVLEEANLEKPRLVVIEKDIRFSEIADHYKTTVANLNKLNKRELSPRQMIKGGSQLFIPSR